MGCPLQRHPQPPGKGRQWLLTPRSLGCGRGTEEGSGGGKATQAEVWPRFGSSWQGRAEERDGRNAGLGYKAAGTQAVAEF